MSPRPYTPVARKRAVDEGRDRILSAARDLLQEGDIAAFSLDAVARRAGVTRMTVYNQFGSRGGLLEELFDHLVTRGAFSELSGIFALEDPVAAFDAVIAVLGRFYSENRPTLKRVHAVAGTDPDLGAAIRKRNDRRRRAVETLVQRLDDDFRPTVPDAELVTTLNVLVGFETFDALAGEGRMPADVVPLIRRLVRGVIGAPSRPKATRRVKKKKSP
jgi:AcrR family transcriptional regulator